MTIETPEQARAKADALRRFLAANGCQLGLRKSLDAVAVMEGVANWNTLAARLKTAGGKAPASPAISVIPEGLQRLLQRLTHEADTPSLIALIGEQLLKPETMALWLFLRLQDLCESFDMAFARGEDALPFFDENHAEIHRLLDEAPWSMFPGIGAVPAQREDSNGKPIPFSVPVVLDHSAKGAQQWYYTFSLDGPNLPQLTGPFADPSDLVDALDTLFEELDRPYELNWVADRLPKNPRNTVYQDNGYFEQNLIAASAVERARAMRDSGAGGTWTAAEPNLGKVFAIFR